MKLDPNDKRIERPVGRRWYAIIDDVKHYECTACLEWLPEGAFYRRWGKPRSRCAECARIERRCCRKGIPFSLAVLSLGFLLLQPFFKKLTHDRGHLEVRNMTPGLLLKPLVQVNRQVNGNSHLLHDSIEYGNQDFFNRVLTGNHAI